MFEDYIVPILKAHGLILRQYIFFGFDPVQYREIKLRIAVSSASCKVTGAKRQLVNFYRRFRARVRFVACKKIRQMDDYSFARFQTNSSVSPDGVLGLVNLSSLAVIEVIIRFCSGPPIKFANVLPSTNDDRRICHLQAG